MTITSLAGQVEADRGTRFNVSDYLVQRSLNPSFVMIELGHDSSPVAYQQPMEFAGMRVYIGVEAWLREPMSAQNEEFEKLRSTRGRGQNIFYITHNLGGETKWDEQKEGSWHEGQYNAVTVLPAQIGDEVFLSNVFCDPHLAEYPDRTSALLNELARLVSADGRVVLRETISPQNIQYLNDELLETVGLAVVSTITPINVHDWEALEAVYKGEPSDFVGPEPDSYYMFLSKTAPTLMGLT